MIKEDAFVEYACYVGNYYGTPKAFVEEKISEGKDVLLEIEIQGALKIKEKFPSAVLIFITTKDAKHLKTDLQEEEQRRKMSLKRDLTVRLKKPKAWKLMTTLL